MPSALAVSRLLNNQEADPGCGTKRDDPFYAQLGRSKPAGDLLRRKGAREARDCKIKIKQSPSLTAGPLRGAPQHIENDDNAIRSKRIRTSLKEGAILGFAEMVY